MKAMLTREQAVEALSKRLEYFQDQLKQAIESEKRTPTPEGKASDVGYYTHEVAMTEMVLGLHKDNQFIAELFNSRPL